MRWEGDRESGNVEDRRGMGGPLMVAGGGVGTVIIIVLALLFGRNPAQVLQQVNSGQPQQQSGGPVQASPEEERLVHFVKTVLGDTEDVWQAQLPQQAGVPYRDPKLVLFRGQVQSACGGASAASGPFYCPGDEKVYIDLSFYDELQRRFKAPGDFAQAYVIAHEVGHHVQKLLGTSDRVQAMRARADKVESNRLSVRLELQADFYAGVWAHHAQKMKNILQPGDVDEALRAASAIGDDRIQMQSQGRVVPDAFTHGTAKQRSAWFKKGFQTGDIKQGDTFTMPDPDIRPSDVTRPPAGRPPPLPKPKSDERW
jgi:predicted metalloprotease